jgi:dsDNA-binding SOS-regulon protein
MATERTRRQFMGHTKKMDITTELKKKFLDKKLLIQMEEDSAETVHIFMAVLKNFVSELIESGTSTSRLPQMLLMQQLNSFSSIIPSIMKNEHARNLLMTIEFDKGTLGGKLTKIFR